MPDQQITGKPAGIKGFDEQFEQLRIRYQQLEEQTAQAVGFDEANELIESCIRIRRLGEPLEQDRTQLAKYLTRARRDVEASLPSREICQGFGSGFLIIENFEADFSPKTVRGRFGDNPLKNRADSAHSFPQRRSEIFDRRKAQTWCQPLQRFRFLRDSVCLLFGLDLQTMLDTAEKPICLVERQHFTPRQQVQFTKSSQGSEHTGFLQEWMLRAVDKLKCLHDEFDLANAAPSQLDVALEIVGSDHVALDASLDVGDLIEQIGRRTFGINKRLMLPQEFISQLATAGDSACFNQSQALPGFAETGIVIFHALERPGEWPGRTFRTKAQINAKEGAFRMTCGKCLKAFFSQPVEELVIGQLRRELAFLAVEKKKVDIGAVIQLGASEFTHC